MTIEASYLEYRTGNSEKFYRAFLDGRLVVAEWGRIGTSGQSKVWKHDTSAQAGERFRRKLDEKRDRGYVEVADPLPPSSYRERIEAAHKAVPYELFWFATSAVTRASLKVAAREADRLLAGMGRFAEARVEFKADAAAPDPSGYVVMSAGGRHTHFGFPSTSFREQMSEAGRGLGEQFVSLEGWLGSNGKGQGVIQVGHDSLDLPVRVFLCRLMAALGEGFRAEDLYGEVLTPWIPKPTESVGNRFAWVQHYGELTRALEAEGLLPGTVRADARLETQLGGEALSVAPLW